MFSKVSVKNSVHEGMHGKGHMWQGGVCGGGCAWQGACMAGGGCVEEETATAADGTHPSGSHSCYKLYWIFTTCSHLIETSSLYEIFDIRARSH